MNYIFDTYLPAHPIQGIFLEGRWGKEHISGIARTIDWAKSHNVPIILFGPVPEYDEALPRLLAYSVAWGKPSHITEHTVGKIAAIDAQLQELAASTWHVPYISLYQQICASGDCLLYADPQQTIPLMQDRDHFTRQGAMLIVRRLVEEGKIPGI
jgi:lysophospholipase L1-like esterase